MKRIVVIIALFPLFADAQLQPAKIFSDNMVLQRDQPIHFWGKFIPGKKVVVQFAGNKQTATVAKDSSWSIYFPKQKATAKPHSITISSDDEKIQYSNIVVGDIWVCSGQSNMEWSMEREMHWKEEKQNASQPLIRFINPPPAGRYVHGVAFTDSLNRRLNKDSFYLWNGWKTCDSNTIKPMSAVAYYFAKAIINRENIPIGLINLSIGGAPAETFISVDAMRNNKQFAAKVNGNWLTNDKKIAGSGYARRLVWIFFYLVVESATP